MRIAILVSALLLAGVLPAAAQSVEGNWECRKGEAPGGLLAIYGASYTYASTAFGDRASGSGSVAWTESGPRFIDGPFVNVLGIHYGLMVSGGSVIPMDLIGNDTAILNCIKRERGMSTAPVAPGGGVFTPNPVQEGAPVPLARP